MPDYWKISFTGSTGGSDNIHEIGGLRVCAQTVLPPTGGTASGFSAIDEAYPGAPTVPAYQNFQTGDIYMKLTGVPFRLWVAALSSYRHLNRLFRHQHQVRVGEDRRQQRQCLRHRCRPHL